MLHHCIQAGFEVGLRVLLDVARVRFGAGVLSDVLERPVFDATERRTMFVVRVSGAVPCGSRAWCADRHYAGQR